MPFASFYVLDQSFLLSVALIHISVWKLGSRDKMIKSPNNFGVTKDMPSWFEDKFHKLKEILWKKWTL